MTTGNPALRALLVYAVVIPLALVVGYMLADPLDIWSFGVVGFVLILLAAPLLLKWHHQLLFLVWNMNAVLFFLPGRPQAWLGAVAVSLVLSILERSLVRDTHFIHAPSVAVPLLFLAVVVYVTGELTGGFGLQSMGSSSIGGRRYVEIFAGIAGFFALTSKPIPPNKALLYLGLFFLGAITDAISNTINFVNPALWYIFLIFPAEVALGQETIMMRFAGASFALMGIFWYMLARYGIRELLAPSKLWRPALVLAVFVITTFSGFRSFFILMIMTFLVLFYFEGLFRTKYAGILLFFLIGACVVVVPLADKLPVSVQRTLSVLPLDVSHEARVNAQDSSQWRLKMWADVLPEVPQYLWLGKGLTMDEREFQMANLMSRSGGLEGSTASFELAASYHNGPLTTIIPFGIWGLLGWVWFLAASIRALHSNHLHGEPYLKKINTFLLAYFVARAIYFFTVFGNFYTDVPIFAGVIALNIALNGGIRKPVPVPVVAQPVRLGRFGSRGVAPVPGLSRST